MGQKMNPVYLLYKGHQNIQCHQEFCNETENGKQPIYT